MTPWDAVADFGRSIGLSSLQLEHGSAVLELDDGARLGLVLTDEDLIISLVQSLPHASPRILERALQASEARDLPGFRVQAGSRGQGADFALVAAARLPVATLLPELIAQSSERLIDWMNRVAEVG